MIFRPGRGVNYFMVFNFTCMHCGDLNSAHNDFFKVYLVSIYWRSFTIKKGEGVVYCDLDH